VLSPPSSSSPSLVSCCPHLLLQISLPYSVLWSSSASVAMWNPREYLLDSAVIAPSFTVSVPKLSPYLRHIQFSTGTCLVFFLHISLLPTSIVCISIILRKHLLIALCLYSVVLCVFAQFLRYIYCSPVSRFGWVSVVQKLSVRVSFFIISSFLVSIQLALQIKYTKLLAITEWAVNKVQRPTRHITGHVGDDESA